MSRIGVPSGNRRLALVRLLFVGFLLAITVRLFDLQIVKREAFSVQASEQHELEAELQPQRGEVFVQDVFDADGTYPVAVNQSLNLVFAVPSAVTDPAKAAEQLAPVLGLEAGELQSKLEKQDDPYEPLQHAASDETADKVNELGLAGIRTAPEVVRYYPDGRRFSHVLGFVGYVNERKQGQYGIEQYWEQDLAGRAGRILAERGAGGDILTLGEKDIEPAVDGASLVLTLDKDIQRVACEALERGTQAHGAIGGSVVVMDPATGAVKALCSTPGFDPNQYSEVEDAGTYLNPAVSVPYEPGSVFKAITMAAALDAGAVTPETTYFDSGEVVIGPNTIRNSDLKAHGVQTMTQVLEQSLNTGAIFAMRQVGAKAFSSKVRDFGFGQVTRIELPHEQPGNLRSLTEKQEIYAATASFGQGITVTPLQLASAFGAIANRGRLMQPYLVQEVRRSDGSVERTEPTFVRQVISPQTSATLSAMLVQVVEQGHGKRAGVKGYYVAGKTGTAQVPLTDRAGYDPTKTIGSFVGFAPVGAPKFVAIVKVAEPKGVVFAESSAAPIFGEVAKFLLEYYQVPPERTSD